MELHLQPIVILTLGVLLTTSAIGDSRQGFHNIKGNKLDSPRRLKTEAHVHDKVTFVLWSSLRWNIIKNKTASTRHDTDNITVSRERPFSKNAGLGRVSPVCKAGEFLTKKKRCQQCTQCSPDEIMTFPCTAFKDSTCRPKKLRYTRCVDMFKRRHFKKNMSSYLVVKKAIRPHRLRRCFKYLATYLMKLNVRKSRKGNPRHKRDAQPQNQDADHVIKKKLSKGAENTTIPSRFPPVHREEDSVPNFADKPVPAFEDSAEDETFWTRSFDEKKGAGTPQLSSSSDSSGPAPWVFITIGAAVIMLLATTIALTFLYRRHKRNLHTTSPDKRVSDPPEQNRQHLIYDTQRSGSTDKGTERSKSTVSTYLSRDSTDRGIDIECHELMPLTSGHVKERSSVVDLFSPSGDSEKLPLRSVNIEPEWNQPLPYVTMMNMSSAPPTESGRSFLRACVSGREEEEDDSRSSVLSKNVFSSRRDDGNKLRGGNGNFQRRYVDVDYVHNDLGVHRPRKSEYGSGGSRRSAQRNSSRWSPEPDYNTQPLYRRSNERGRNKSNGSSSTSHHSARSYISMPPTSPSENYIEAGSDDTSVRSGQSTPPIKMEWLTKTFKTDARNELRNYQSSFGTQTDTSITSPEQKTVFGTSWQFGGTFTSRGGMMQATDSDVALMVAANSVPKGVYMDIYGAVFTDTVEIRKKFDFPVEESLITPLVEYCALPSNHFYRPVRVQLPHCLPEEFDVSMIKVYTFTVDEYGKICLSNVPMSCRSNTDTVNEVSWEKGHDDCSIHINTAHFSGYFCTLCEASSLPSICTMVFGSHVQITETRREVRVILYIWDRRLTIKDYLERFRKQESDVDRQLLTDMQIPLLDSASSDSRVVMRMEVMGEDDDRQSWRHVSRPDGSRPLFKPLQVRKLSEVVHCCRQTDPIRVEWALENAPRQVPGVVFQCCIDIMHVPESTRDYETAMREDNDDLMRTFYVRDLKVTPQSAQDLKPSENFQRMDLKRTISEAMDMEQTEKMCHEFGISFKDIGNFRKKFSTEETFQVGLVEECLRRYGQDKFVQQLPLILERLCMPSVLSRLEEKKVFVRNLADFAGLPGGPEQTSKTESHHSALIGNESGSSGRDRTRQKSPYRQRSPTQRKQSASPPGRRSRDEPRESQKARYRQQMPENNEVFVHDNLGHRQHQDHTNDNTCRSREPKRSSSSHREGSPPIDYDENDHSSSYDVRYDRKYPVLEHERRQPMKHQKASSSGTDSVLQGSSMSSSVYSRNNNEVPESTCYSSRSTLGSSLAAQADSRDFAEPYPDEFLDEFQKQTYKKELAASQNLPMLFSQADIAAYPEITEELHLSDSGPNAIPPLTQEDKPSSSVNVSRAQLSPQLGVPPKSLYPCLSQRSDRDETSKKELYGIHTVV